MRKKVRIILLVLLSGIFAVSVFFFVRELLQYRKGEETYQEAEELAGIPDFSEVTPSSDGSGSAGASSASSAQTHTVYVDPYAQQLKNMDFSALQKVNSDVLGWILIPGSVISYPLLQTSNNTYYLRHTWKKQTSVVGAIFLEHQSTADFSDFNTIIYGHNMNNGSMFGTLKKYKSRSWWKAHPTVYITDANGSRAYEIFAAYEVSTTGTTYQIGFPSDASRQSFLDYCVGQSLIDTGVTPTIYDQILTLSTCTGRGHATRWVVQAVLKNPEPQQTESTPPADQTPQEGAASSASSSQEEGGAAAQQAAGSAAAASSAQQGGESSGASSSASEQKTAG